MTTQSKYPWRATVRTLFQAFLALAVMYGPVAATANLPDTALFAGVATVMAAVTRVMQLPAVNAFIEQFVPFLAAAPRSPDTEQ